MKTLEQWLDQYAVSHQNRTNQIFHKICVPLIFFSVLGMLWDWKVMDLRLSYVFAILGMMFYVRLGVKASLLMLFQLAVSFVILTLWSEHAGTVFWPNLAIFVIAWIGQFIGHKIEGKKPSFFEDLQFLFIGPLWVFSFVFKSKS
ncbi:MAG: DUF962 domain-containing protein [Bdellovibrionales bacterium]|nr:DUF962 domain-containing protein [Bdellovibrionales bacterium]